MGVLAQKLDKTKFLGLIGVGAQQVGALARAQAKAKWSVVVLAKAIPPPNTGRFFKSVKDNVDAAEKKSSYGVMIAELFDAIEQDDFQASLNEAGVVTVKVAHSFRFGGQKHNVWELKYGKKDRIYFYPLPQHRLIFLLLAYHKRDQKTPDEVCRACEADVKLLLDPKLVIEYC